ncbi:hypothetical protein [Streptomyces sp. AC512_CC834]|uniref:hypothetical protein n=1 Tax=Streptomyces sp. AC512_CC834 TaxID=2823691 RepID=UPI001C272A80|nr:hypothetical protein [Streptomyces sp. AC512_CC834]
MGNQRDLCADLSHRLVQALDAWAACVGEPTTRGKPTRKALVKVLEAERETPVWRSRKKIDEALLSYWLRGRNQLLPGTKHNRLPSEEDSEAIARALRKKQAPESAQQLPSIGREIADLARSLQEAAGPGWRSRVLTSITVQSDELVEVTDIVEPAGPLDPEGATERAVAGGPAGAEDPLAAPHRAAGRQSPKYGWLWAGAGAAVGVAVAVALLGWLDSGKSASPSVGKSPDGLATQSAQGADVVNPDPVASTESGGVKGNHQCGKVRSAGAVLWTPCTLVAEDGRASFLVQLTNTSGKPVTVEVKLAYVQSEVELTCPGPWGRPGRITLPAKETRTSPLEACTVPLTPAQAFQARIWVVPDGAAQWGYREHSPTLHVQADGTAMWSSEA